MQRVLSTALVINEHSHRRATINDLSDVFLTSCLTGDFALRSRSLCLLESWGDGDLRLRTAGLCLCLGEGERRRRGDGDLRRRGDWLLCRCADVSPPPLLCFTSNSPRTLGDLDFDLFRRGDFLFLSRDDDRAVRALTESDLSWRLGDLDLDSSFLWGDRDPDLHHSTLQCFQPYTLYSLLPKQYNISYWHSFTTDTTVAFPNAPLKSVTWILLFSNSNVFLSIMCYSLLFWTAWTLWS